MSKSKLWYIRTNDLFSGLTEAEQDRIASMMTEAHVRKKESAYGAADISDKVYLLKKGSIKITRLAEDGREMTIDIIGSGDIFGYFPHDEQEGSGASAVALEDSFICVIDRKNFEDFLVGNPHLSLKVTKWMGLRLRRIENRLENMIFQDVKSRLMSALRGLAREYGEDTQSGRMVKIRLSHQEIANLIGASRETVTTELNSLKRDGRIIVDNRFFVLPSGE